MPLTGDKENNLRHRRQVKWQTISCAYRGDVLSLYRMQDTSLELKPINDVSDDFAELRKHHAIYVDKTAFIRDLVSDENSKFVFASRPRRFGKSLTISTLKYLFQGRRDLFTGLAIDKSDWEWKKHPIIHFAFNDELYAARPAR